MKPQLLLESSLSYADPLPWAVGHETTEGERPHANRQRVLVSEEHDLRTVLVGEADPSICERLFQATAAAKIWTSQIAMRLDPAAKERFFRQLDRLHDPEEWLEGDRPLALDSYKSFIRAVLSVGLDAMPDFALSSAGNLIAMWGETNRLTLEFQPGDRVRWLVVEQAPSGRERAAGETGIDRLPSVLSPYDAVRWLNAG